MIVIATIVACGLIIAQGCAVWAFLRFVQSFGVYTDSQRKMTDALLYTHESSLLVHQQQQKILEELRTLALKKEVA